MEKQRTIAREAYLEGVGLHTGNMSRVTFSPAPAGSGIKFIRTDLPGRPVIAATCDKTLGLIRGTSIGTDSVQVHTVEHILAVCAGIGIDNLDIELTNNEPPVLDGSAKLFADLILKTGLTEQDAPRAYFTPSAPVTYEAGETKITAYPADELSVDCTVIYKHPFLGKQHVAFSITPETFMNEIASARTFCFDYEIEALKKKGLAKGGDLSNAIVVSLTGIHNKDSLRYPDEFVRHKMLDLLGDMYLIGRPLKARVVAVKCGHNHNINFTKELLKNGSR